jgi:hypothetical protein
MIRRTITVDDVLNKVINMIRAKLLMIGIDLDYTSTMNMLVALGAFRWLSATAGNNPFTNEEWTIVEYYIAGNKELKWESTIDQLIDEFIKTKLPQILEKFNKI